VTFSEKKRGPFLQEARFTSRDLGDVETLNVRVADASNEESIQLVGKAAELIKALHAADFYHRDLHCGNVVVSAENDLYVVDLHRMSRGVNRAAIVRNLATLFGPSCSPFSEDEARQGVEHYCELAGMDDPEEIFSLSSSLAEEITERHLASRTLRCMAESSRYTMSRLGSARVYHRRILSSDDVSRILEAHDAGKDAAVHDSKRSIATRVECNWMDDSPVVFAKEEKGRGVRRALFSLLFGSRTKNAWLASSALEVRGVPTPEPLAFIERSLSGEGNIIVTRFVENAVPLDEMALRDLAGEDKQAIIAALAPVCGALHRFDIYHSDWSTKNFLICPIDGETWRACVVDSEAVRLRSRLTRDRVIKNLGQLNDVPGFSDDERAAFLEIYRTSGGADLSEDELRQVSGYTRRRVEARAKKAAAE
jgi:tRNA A-37 threonylcarbamoyl transferase component Bud32